MTLPRRAVVVGLGLMGGSLARDLAALGVEVWGYDADPAAARAARDEGVLHAELPSSLEGAEQADLLVVATPVAAAEAVLERLAPRLRPECLVTDLGSTKRSIVEAAERLGLGERFVGSHPLTGDHRSGWIASRQGLFAGARVYLCPSSTTGPSTLEGFRELWLRLGAIVEMIGAEAHDRRLAWTSHLPQVASSALARVIDREGLDRAVLGPGGRDTTRLAGSSPEMWTPVCLENAELIDQAVRALIDQLSVVRAALRSRDGEALHHFFAAARAWSLEEPRDS